MLQKVAGVRQIEAAVGKVQPARISLDARHTRRFHRRRQLLGRFLHADHVDVIGGRGDVGRENPEPAADLEHAHARLDPQELHERRVRHAIESGQPLLLARMGPVDVGVRLRPRRSVDDRFFRRQVELFGRDERSG